MKIKKQSRIIVTPEGEKVLLIKKPGIPYEIRYVMGSIEKSLKEGI